MILMQRYCLKHREMLHYASYQFILLVAVYLTSGNRKLKVNVLLGDASTKTCINAGTKKMVQWTSVPSSFHYVFMSFNTFKGNTGTRTVSWRCLHCLSVPLCHISGSCLCKRYGKMKISLSEYIGIYILKLAVRG